MNAQGWVVSPVIGTGTKPDPESTEDDYFRGAVHDRAGADGDRLEAVIPSNPDGTPRFGFALCAVAVADPSVLPNAEIACDLDDIDRATVNLSPAKRQRLQTLVDRHGVTGVTTPRDFIRKLGRRLDGRFDERVYLGQSTPAPRGSFGSDDFNDTDGVALGSHTADAGGPWVEHASHAFADPLIQTNRLRTQSASELLWYLTADPATAEYDVASDIFMKSVAPSTTDAGVAARIDTAANTYYYAKADGSEDQWKIVKVVVSAGTILNTYDEVFVDETSYALQFEIRNATKKLYVGGVERASSTDNAITAKGKAGIYKQGTESSTTGKHLDNFTATDLAAGFTMARREAGVWVPRPLKHRSGGVFTEREIVKL